MVMFKHMIPIYKQAFLVQQKLDWSWTFYALFNVYTPIPSG